MNAILSFFIQRHDQLNKKRKAGELGRGSLGNLVCEVNKKVNPKDMNQFILFSFSIYCCFPFAVSSNIHLQGLGSTLSSFCSLDQGVRVLKETGRGINYLS